MTAARALAIAGVVAAAALAAAIPACTEVVELHGGPAGLPDATLPDAGFIGDAFPADDGGDPSGDASAFGDGGPAFPIGDGGAAD